MCQHPTRYLIEIPRHRYLVLSEIRYPRNPQQAGKYDSEPVVVLDTSAMQVEAQQIFWISQKKLENYIR